MTSKKERYLKKIIRVNPKEFRAMQSAKESTMVRLGVGTATLGKFHLHKVHNNYTRTHGGYWRLKIEHE